MIISPLPTSYHMQIQMDDMQAAGTLTLQLGTGGTYDYVTVADTITAPAAVAVSGAASIALPTITMVNDVQLNLLIDAGPRGFCVRGTIWEPATAAAQDFWVRGKSDSVVYNLIRIAGTSNFDDSVFQGHVIPA